MDKLSVNLLQVVKRTITTLITLTQQYDTATHIFVAVGVCQ